MFILRCSPGCRSQGRESAGTVREYRVSRWRMVIRSMLGTVADSGPLPTVGITRSRMRPKRCSVEIASSRATGQSLNAVRPGMRPESGRARYRLAISVRATYSVCACPTAGPPPPHVPACWNSFQRKPAG